MCKIKNENVKYVYKRKTDASAETGEEFEIDSSSLLIAAIVEDPRRTMEDLRETLTITLITVTQGFEIMPMSSSEDLSEELGGTKRSSEEP